MTTVKLIAYRRVSTRGQLDRYGLAAQETDLRRYARQAGLRIVRIETDGAKTGTLPADQRPALLACLKAISDGEAVGLLAPSLDRIARELTVQEAVLGQVWSLGGVVHTAESGEVPEDDPDDPMRTAMRQMRGVFAQLDRALIVKRMRNGRRAKSETGGYAGYGSPAFGTRSASGVIVTDAAEAETVALIRELAESGMSIRAITQELNARGALSKRGGSWHPQTVARVLARATAAESS
jgi:DNA invertase Pin-like site-specific DNA recombinase